MNTIDGPGHDPDDEALLTELGNALDVFDPPPTGLVERIQFALALENLDVEVASWERAEALAGVRGAAENSTITITVSDLTVMVNLTRIGRGHRIDGWLVPCGTYAVEVRVDGHGSHRTTADEGGRFVLDNVPRGTTQLVVTVDGARRRTVVTPTIVL